MCIKQFRKLERENLVLKNKVKYLTIYAININFYMK